MGDESSSVVALLLLLSRKGVTSYERLSSAIPLIDKVRIRTQKDSIVAEVESYIVKLGQDGSYSCTCPDFTYRHRICKHIIATLLKADPTTSTKILESFLHQKPITQKTYSSGIKELDELAPIPAGIIGVIGPSKVGKTMFVSQMLYKISADTKKPALYVDTEGFYTVEAIARSESIFTKRFGQDARSEFIQLRTLESLMSFLGLSITLEAKEKKMEATIMFTSPAEETPALKMAEFLDASAMAIDSFTMPIKRVFGSGTQNLPARAALINGMFARLEEISTILEIPIFITHHVGKSPINPYDPYKPYGGASLMYNLKHILLILPGKDSEERRVIRYVWPYLSREEISLYLERDWGYVGKDELSRNNQKSG